MSVATLAGAVTSRALVAFARFLTAARAEWRGVEPAATPRVYFANHASHADFVLVSSVMPPAVRGLLRPVAAADYWLRGSLRRFLIVHVFRGVLIERRRSDDRRDPVEAMTEALDGGASLLLFPEGTRNTTDAVLPFKRGIYRLAAARPQLELVPVWIDKVDRVLPKGALVPVPLRCTVTFAAPIKIHPGETETAFLGRARTALIALVAHAHTATEALGQ